MRRIKAARGATAHDEHMDARVQPAPRTFWTSVKQTPPLVAVTSPAIYSLIIPFALTDLWVSLYQAICFPIYGIERVQRRAYFKTDRAKLSYLNALEKFNCIYCSYVNGVIGFVREVAARTEQYWCPIKHQSDPIDPHERYAQFSGYGEGVDHVTRRDALRTALRKPPQPRTVTPAVRPLR